MEIVLQKPRTAQDWLSLQWLYLRAFPREERKPFVAIRRMFREGRADVWCIRSHGKFVGMATTVNGAELILVDYFAITEKSRGRGIGSGALDCLLSVYGDKGVFLEIESTQSPGQGRELRLKRKAFYQACGLESLNVHARVFGVPMELLGIRCKMDYRAYRDFYRDNLSPWAAEHLEEM